MRAIFLFFICLILGINSAYSYELVLPKEKKTITSSNFAFFVGKAGKDESIVINDVNGDIYERTANIHLLCNTTFLRA